MKIWLCCITQNAKQDIDEMTKDIMPYIDGLVFVDHFSTDGTRELLEERKKEGEIISLPWMANHGWSMQGFLNSDKIQPGDYFIVLDSSERLASNFAPMLPEFIKLLNIRNINAVYHYSKLVIAKYTTNLLFSSTPHWGIQYVQAPVIRLEDSFPDPQTCIFSTRNLKRPKDHFINHFVKYYLYKISNHLLLGREDKYGEFLVHEEVRNKFRLHCLNKLQINPLNPDTLLNYFQSLKLRGMELGYETKWFINYERILNDFYCYRVFGHSLDDILERHKKGELFHV